MPIFANMGDRPGALANVEKGIRLRRQILASPGATLDDRIAYGDILLLLGHLKLSAGNPAAAIGVYLQATREFEAVRAASGHPAGRLLSRLGSSYLYSALAYAGNGALPDTGDAQAALPLFEKALRLMPLERKARQGQAPALRMYLSSNEALIEISWAIALTQLLRADEADAHYKVAVSLIHSPGIDSGNAEIARKEGLVELNYANALIERGELESAGPHLASSVRIFAKLLRSDPENVASQEDAVSVTASQGRLDIASGHYAAGLALLDRAITEEERTFARDRDFAHARGLLSRLYLSAGDGCLKARRPARAGMRYRQAADLAKVTAQRHPDDANAELMLAAAEVGIARTDPGNAAQHRELATAAARAVLAAHPDH
jgi:tetratricopeptide (TPR) repeat protein